MLLPLGLWDLVSTYNWACNLLKAAVTPIGPFRGNISKLISPVISSS